MNRRIALLAAPLAVLAVATLAPADTGKLGEGYEKAASADKLVLLSVARADKTMTVEETGKAASQVVHDELAKGKTPEERLKLLGGLIKNGQEGMKKANEERKGQKKPYASFIGPESALQQAVALDYHAATAGPRPSLDALDTLKHIRDNTDWTATGSHVVLPILLDSLARQKDYAEGKPEERLAAVQRLAERGLMSDFERSTLEGAPITDWLTAELKAGKAPNDLLAEIKKMADAKKICAFTSMSARGMVDRLAHMKR